MQLEANRTALLPFLRPGPSNNLRTSADEAHDICRWKGQLGSALQHVRQFYYNIHKSPLAIKLCPPALGCCLLNY